MKKIDTHQNADQLMAKWIFAGFVAVLILSAVIYYTVIAK